MRKFKGKFSSIIDLKVKLMEEFGEQIPTTVQFSVGYFEGRQSTKKWLVSQDDLAAMYVSFTCSGKTSICLWCEGNSDDSSSRKRNRDGSPGPSKRAVKEREVDDITEELKELHDNYSDPQYRLWARMIVNGLHSSKDVPPQVPMITGVTPTRSTRRSLEDTVASTVSAVVKAIGTPHSLPVAQSVAPQLGVGISPGKAVDIRGKCFSQLSSLKQLFEECYYRRRTKRAKMLHPQYFKKVTLIYVHITYEPLRISASFNYFI